MSLLHRTRAALAAIAVLSASLACSAAPAGALAVTHDSQAVLVGGEYVAWKADVTAGTFHWWVTQAATENYAIQQWVFDSAGNMVGGPGMTSGHSGRITTVSYDSAVLSVPVENDTINPLFPYTIAAGTYTFVTIVNGGDAGAAHVSLVLPAGSVVTGETTGPASSFTERDFDSSQPEVRSPVSDVRSVHGSISVTASHRLLGLVFLGYDGGTATVTYPDNTVETDPGFVDTGAGTTTVTVDIEGAGIGTEAPTFFVGLADVVLP